MAGYVAVCLESNIEATDYDLRITTVLADICAIEMQKHDFFVTRSGMKYENFLVDLLEGRFHDVNLISSRLELLDRKFCQFFCLVVFIVYRASRQQFCSTNDRCLLSARFTPTVCPLYIRI